MFKSVNSRAHEILLELLRQTRATRRLRQSDLADRLGRGQATVSKVESGERRLDVIELRAWLNALDTDFVSFMRALEAELRLHPMPDAHLRGRRSSSTKGSRPGGRARSKD